MISEKEILVEFDKWLKTDSAKRIQDMQTKVKIMKSCHISDTYYLDPLPTAS